MAWKLDYILSPRAGHLQIKILISYKGPRKHPTLCLLLRCPSYPRIEICFFLGPFWFPLLPLKPLSFLCYRDGGKFWDPGLLGMTVDTERMDLGIQKHISLSVNPSTLPHSGLKKKTFIFSQTLNSKLLLVCLP